MGTSSSKNEVTIVIHCSFSYLYRESNNQRNQSSRQQWDQLKEWKKISIMKMKLKRNYTVGTLNISLSERMPRRRQSQLYWPPLKLSLTKKLLKFLRWRVLVMAMNQCPSNHGNQLSESQKITLLLILLLQIIAMWLTLFTVTRAKNRDRIYSTMPKKSLFIQLLQ
jgi:hypothetical protein